MKKLYNAISKILYRTSVMSDEEYYYSQACDLVDLERRMRLVQKGLAPFQNGIKGW